MKQELLTEVLLEMREYVDNGQLKQLEKVMRHILFRSNFISNFRLSA